MPWPQRSKSRHFSSLSRTANCSRILWRDEGPGLPSDYGWPIRLEGKPTATQLTKVYIYLNPPDPSLNRNCFLGQGLYFLQEQGLDIVIATDITYVRLSEVMLSPYHAGPPSNTALLSMSQFGLSISQCLRLLGRRIHHGEGRKAIPIRLYEHSPWPPNASPWSLRVPQDRRSWLGRRCSHQLGCLHAISRNRRASLFLGSRDLLPSSSSENSVFGSFHQFGSELHHHICHPLRLSKPGISWC